MVHLYWDFENDEELKKLDPLLRVELAEAFRDKLNIPISPHVAGFNNPYVEILSNDPIQRHPLFPDGMIPRAGFITRVSVRHLTYQDEKFIQRIREIAAQVFLDIKGLTKKR